MKKTAIINKFRTSDENKKYIQKLQGEQEFDVPESTIAEHLLNLGIEEHRKRNKKK